MWEEILNIAVKDGIWAMLFVGILIFVMHDSRARERKYILIVDELTFHLGIVKKIDESLTLANSKLDNLKKLVLHDKK